MEMTYDESVTIVNDSEKGRCLISRKAFSPGDVLYVETAFIFSSCNDAPIQECFNYAFDAYKPFELEKLEEMAAYLSQLSRVGSMDTARNILELIAIYRLKQSASLNMTDLMKTNLELFSALTAANIEECTENMQMFRERYPTVIPAAVTPSAAGALLGILNTNQIELEDICGSGLFVGTAVAEHNCSPNASFSTSGNTLCITCIKDIAIGDRVSIDYGNYFYDCTPDRIRGLYETYNFICTCDTCKVFPDLKRCFHCPLCTGADDDCAEIISNRPFNDTKTVYPIGYDHVEITPSSSDGFERRLEVFISKWQCNSCLACLSRPDIERLEAYEVRVKDSIEGRDDEDDMEEESVGYTIESLNDIVQQRVLCASHYLLYFPLNDLAMRAVEDARCNPQANSTNVSIISALGRQYISIYDEAAYLMQLLTKYLEHMLPRVHHEKVIHYDRLGQLYVCMACNTSSKDAHRLAGEYFALAYRCSQLACGEMAPLTITLKKLCDKTPTNLVELMSYYNGNTGVSIQNNDLTMGSSDVWTFGMGTVSKPVE